MIMMMMILRAATRGDRQSEMKKNSKNFETKGETYYEEHLFLVVMHHS